MFFVFEKTLKLSKLKDVVIKMLTGILISYWKSHIEPRPPDQISQIVQGNAPSSEV